MKYAIIENGAIANIAESNAPLESNWIAADDTAHIGGTWDGTSFHPAPVVRDILSEIKALEATVTPRRQREFDLGQDTTWLPALDAQIASLRAQLNQGI